MADGTLPFQNPTATDARIDTESLTVAAQTVHRERVRIAGLTATQLAPVDSIVGLTTNTVGINGATISTGNGTSNTGTARVNICSDNTAFPVTVASTTISSGTVTANQGGTWTVQPGNTPNSAPWLTTNTPATTGGYTISRIISGASTNNTSAKASAGQVFGWYITNINASPRYFKLFNKASAPNPAADTPVLTILLPGNATGAGTNVEYMNGIPFSTGIAYCLTTGAADLDSGAVASGDIIVNLFYK